MVGSLFSIGGLILIVASTFVLWKLAEYLYGFGCWEGFASRPRGYGFVSFALPWVCLDLGPNLPIPVGSHERHRRRWQAKLCWEVIKKVDLQRVGPG